MNYAQHMDREYQKELCYLYWDIFNIQELIALSPSTTHPTAIQYSSFVLCIITCIIGFTSNITVIFVTGFLMRKNKSQIWFLNLALADFTFLLFLPLYAVSVITAGWPYGSSMCKLYFFFSFLNMYAGIYILTALNIDRALSVAKPIWHRNFFSRKFSYGICSLIWVLSVLCSIPAMIYSEVHYINGPQCLLFPNDLSGIVYYNNDQNSNESQSWRSLPRNLCDEPFENSEMFQEWMEIFSTTTGLVVSLAVIGCVIPLCVILFSNIIIVLHVKNSQKTSSSKLYRVVTAAVLAFFSTRTPLVLAQIIYLVAVYTLRFTLMYKVIASLPLLSSIAAINTFLNPVVYVLVGKQVRNEISQVFGKLQMQHTPFPCT
ncbi:C3a anaphylatoxin chemotactic receptor-like [Eleutherodactylus coqui]|uniref:C3a anaphylatoxin chemotactic receptor-like n=1 Tax=Eleutherodactylus coqui TaxID=57060 RepID=UPI0034620219